MCLLCHCDRISQLSSYVGAMVRSFFIRQSETKDVMQATVLIIKVKMNK